MARDTIKGTFGVALGVCLVCSVLVSVAAVSLKPTQNVNKALDKKRNILMLIIVGLLSYLYLSLINEPGTKVTFFNAIDGFDVPGGLLTVFVSVVFVNSPTVFRIVRGLTLDIKTRDYVSAAQTRGEGAWYIMLWEILPNASCKLSSIVSLSMNM